MKRLGLFLLAVLMVAGLIGCGGGSDDTKNMTGTWRVTIASPTPQVITLELEEAASRQVHGHVLNPVSLDSVVGGYRLAGTDLFSLTSQEGVFSIDYVIRRVVYSVALDGDAFAGTCQITAPGINGGFTCSAVRL